MRDDQLIQLAVARCGTVRSLARTLGIKPMTAYQWRNRRSLPAGWRAYLLEKLADPQWPRERDSEGRAPVIEEDV